MKKATAILLTCCLLAQCLIQLGMIGLFRLNQRYIAANLCENIAKPELNCCGKCYLNKQLRKSEEGPGTGKTLPGKQLKGESLVYILPAPFRLSTMAAAPPPAVHNPARSAHFSTAPSGAVFHPPAALVRV